MFRLLASGFLILTLLLESGTKSILFLNFELHKEYIAQMLCEKKDVPQNSCKGNCQLNKKFKEQDERESKQSPVITYKSEVGIYELPSFEVLFFNHFIELIQYDIFSYTALGFIRQLLRPPSL